jgi:hypothetical protein
MSEGVFELLEIVDVDHDDSNFRPDAPGTADFAM